VGEGIDPTLVRCSTLRESELAQTRCPSYPHTSTSVGTHPRGSLSCVRSSEEAVFNDHDAFGRRADVNPNGELDRLNAEQSAYTPLAEYHELQPVALLP